jgi:hypothetical protein
MLRVTPELLNFCTQYLCHAMAAFPPQAVATLSLFSHPCKSTSFRGDCHDPALFAAHSPLDLFRMIDAGNKRVGVTRQAWMKMVRDEWLHQRPYGNASCDTIS